MPELAAVGRLREQGWNDRDVRLFLTFLSAMNRARDWDHLCASVLALAKERPWAFQPGEICSRRAELVSTLQEFGVSQRHGPNARAWSRIGESLSSTQTAPAVHAAVYDGLADAILLDADVQGVDGTGKPLFPLLRGPKVRLVWIRTLVVPGNAQVTSLGALPVAVDAQVRKVTEYLGLTKTRGLTLQSARPIVQRAWLADVQRHGAEGPGSLEGTCSALDTALWFYAKWGCTFCEKAGRKRPISEACVECRFEEPGLRKDRPGLPT